MSGVGLLAYFSSVHLCGFYAGKVSSSPCRGTPVWHSQERSVSWVLEQHSPSSPTGLWCGIRLTVSVVTAGSRRTSRHRFLPPFEARRAVIGEKAGPAHTCQCRRRKMVARLRWNSGPMPRGPVPSPVPQISTRVHLLGAYHSLAQYKFNCCLPQPESPRAGSLGLRWDTKGARPHTL